MLLLIYIRHLLRFNLRRGRPFSFPKLERPVLGLDWTGSRSKSSKTKGSGDDADRSDQTLVGKRMRRTYKLHILMVTLEFNIS